MRLQWAPVKKRAGKAAAHLPVHMIKLTDARDHALCLGASERGALIRIIWGVPLARRAYARFSCGCFPGGILCTALRGTFPARSAVLQNLTKLTARSQRL